MASENRWSEYAAGTLVPPVVVQHDTLYEGTAKEEHLVWVYTVTGIMGPWSRKTYDSVNTLADIVDILARQEAEANAEEFMEE